VDVDSERFDDVEFKILESPEPAPRRRRRGRVAVVTLVVAAGLAAGASALASSDEPVKTDTPRAHPADFHKSDGWRDGRRGHECKRGGKRHNSRRPAPDTALQY
jgi:hypothetical protein